MTGRNPTLAGAALLLFGLFTPIVTMPIVGNVSLFANGGNISALVLLVLAVLSGGLALKERERDCIWPGGVALVLLVYLFIRLELVIAQVHDQLKNLAGNPFAGLAQAAMGSIQIQWGWIALIAGAGLIVYGAVQSRKAVGEQMLTMNDTTAKGVAAVSVVLALAAIAWDLHTNKPVTPAAPGTPVVGDLGSALSNSGASSTNADATTPSAEEAAYVNQVSLYGLTSKRYDTYSDGKEPGVEFKLKNNGNRTLKEVDVKVVFFGADGKPIAEENYTPVLTSSISFSSDNKPLKPGYIWQQESGKFLTAKSVPSEWQEGKAAATVTKVVFDDGKT